MLLENVGKEHGGIYTCTAHNSLGVSGPKEIVLNVECKYTNKRVIGYYLEYCIFRENSKKNLPKIK